MAHENGHHHHEHEQHNNESQLSHEMSKQERIKLAVSTTLHCLVGCGLGEVVGMIVGVALSLSTIKTVVLAVSLGFVFGFALGIIPLLRKGFTFSKAFRIVLVAEGISIAVMETAEVLVQVYTPGVMEAGLSSWLFWLGMLLSLLAGFVAAYPVNYILIGKGIRHIH
jgi:hypothetical protein